MLGFKILLGYWWPTDIFPKTKIKERLATPSYIFQNTPTNKTKTNKEKSHHYPRNKLLHNEHIYLVNIRKERILFTENIQERYLLQNLSSQINLLSPLSGVELFRTFLYKLPTYLS